MSLDAAAARAASLLRRRRTTASTIAGRPLTELAAQVGRTPFYAYCAPLHERARRAAARGRCPREVHLHYAMKANPMPARRAPHGALGRRPRRRFRARDARSRSTPACRPRPSASPVPASRSPSCERAVRAGIIAQRRVGARDRAPRGDRARTGAAAASRGARQSGLRAQDLRHEDGRRAEAVRRRCRARAAAARDASATLPLEFVGFHIFSGSQNLRAEAIVEAQQKSVALAIELARARAGAGAHAQHRRRLRHPVLPRREAARRSRRSQRICASWYERRARSSCRRRSS